MLFYDFSLTKIIEQIYLNFFLFFQIKKLNLQFEKIY